MSRKVFKYSAVIASLLATALFAGCGTSNKEGTVAAADVAKVEETACAQCHAQAVDKIDPSQTIYAKYNASLHFTNNFHIVGCQDCHGGGAQHNGVGPLPYPNPDAAGQCFSCHEKYLDSNHYATYPANATSTRGDATAKHNAQYVTTDYKNSCTSCHDSHNPKAGQEHKDWAASGHGDVAGLGWANYDFKFGADCTPCHTSTGFISYVSSGYTVPTTTFAKAGDSTHEVLTCKACHTDYNFKNRVRNAGAVKTGFYTYGGAAITFPSVGASNLCITCHSGRGNVEAARTTRFQGHHAPAAGTLFNDKSHMGYEFTEKKASYGNATAFVHSKIGTTAAPGTGTSGPCVACHMYATGNDNSHTFAAATKNTAGTITAVPTAALCAKCHGNITATLDTMRLGYIEAGQLLKAYLDNTITNKLGPMGQKLATSNAGSYSATNPDPYLITNTTNVPDNYYGAYQNYMMVKEEAGAYVHNSTYAKRLLFDSIDWMKNGSFTGSITIPVDYPNARTWFGADANGLVVRP